MTSFLPAIDDEQRKLFHAVFNEWFAEATEADYDRLEAAREHAAPGHICSMLTLARICYRQDLMTELPESLVQRLQARNWPQAESASKSA